MCVCGDVHSKEHVVENCPVSNNARQTVGLTYLEELLNGKYAHYESCKIIRDILHLHAYSMCVMEISWHWS